MGSPRDYTGTVRTNPTAAELAARKAAYTALRPQPKPMSPPKTPKRWAVKKPVGIVHPKHLSSTCRNQWRKCAYRVPGKARSCNGWCEWYGQTIPLSQTRPAECIGQTEAAE